MKFLPIFLIFLLSSCQEQVIKTHDFDRIQNILQMADENTLIVFDIKDVLLKAKDQILQHQNKDYRKQFSKNMSDDLYSIVLLQRELVPVDSRFVGLIDDLQKKEIKVIALTSCLTGKFGKIDAQEDIRIRDTILSEYHFEKSWPESVPENLGYLSIKKPNHAIIFKQGIIFASRAPKGEALKAFLKIKRHNFKKIIFIDNKEKNIVSLQKMASELGVSLVAIHYTGIEENIPQSFNQELANFQFEVLKKERLWLNDEDAMKRLDSIKGVIIQPSHLLP